MVTWGGSPLQVEIESVGHGVYFVRIEGGRIVGSLYTQPDGWQWELYDSGPGDEAFATGKTTWKGEALGQIRIAAADRIAGEIDND